VTRSVGGIKNLSPVGHAIFEDCLQPRHAVGAVLLMSRLLSASRFGGELIRAAAVHT
jgi:hypothetical protein